MRYLDLFSILIIFALLGVNKVSVSQTCATCPGNTVTGYQSSAFGLGDTVSGDYSFAAGRNSQIISTAQNASHYSNVIGSWSRIEKGPHSNVIGSFSQALNDFSFVFGTYAKAKGSYSFAIGSHVEAWSGGSFVIGGGKIDAKLVNAISNSLMIGFNSQYPTLFVSETSSGKQSGKVGIGNVTDPQAKLHIKADANEEASLLIESGAPNQDINIRMGQNHRISATDEGNLNFETLEDRHFVFRQGDIYLEDIQSGIIMKSPNGQCWRGIMTDQGMLSFTQSTCPNENATALKPMQERSQLRVFPNPTSNSITVETSLKGQQGRLLLVSSDGKQLSPMQINSDKTTLNLNSYASGTYLIHLEVNGQIVESAKFVKQ
ncbi:MAG: T9SS type A sorting domain-containing protein [Bacteroidales bacterium]|nr:T9SS type A sorting domain-containing protein [Bacteroidales bacterium]